MPVEFDIAALWRWTFSRIAYLKGRQGHKGVKSKGNERQKLLGGLRSKCNVRDRGSWKAHTALKNDVFRME
jgi:hypothetical protein